MTTKTAAAIAALSLSLAGCETTKTVYVPVVPHLPAPDRALLEKFKHPRCVKSRGEDISVVDLVGERDCFVARAQLVEARFSALVDSVLDVERKVEALREAIGQKPEIPPHLPPIGQPTS